MSSLATPPIPPHFHEHQRLSPTRNMTSQSSGTRKRKASPEDDEMMISPAISNARLPQPLPRSKRFRSNLEGRPLSVDRLLETLDRDALRNVLRLLCDGNPSIREEVTQLAPRPSIHSTLDVLRQYHRRLLEAYPLDPNPRSDYCYDRVRPQWGELLSALTDFTPHFLPPNEQQSSTSLQYLDGVTQIIHDLPEWDNRQYNLAKENAYEEISKAWSTVIKESAKRGGGIQLQHGDWEAKLRAHNQKARGQMQTAYDEIATACGWLRPQTGGNASGMDLAARQSLRDELFAGNYGTSGPNMRTGMY